MWNLAVFLLSYLLKGKPKTKEYYIQSKIDNIDLFDKEMKKIVEDPKWSIEKVENLNIPGYVSVVIHCKEKYY